MPARLKEQLALCATHPEQILFLDIETTGLSHYYDEITVIGWSLGGRVRTLIKGEDHSALSEDAARAKALVTFNGIRFDRRFLAREFPSIALPEVHIDLMYLCRRVGLTGGQKAIESELGLQLRTEVSGVDGFAAVLLWHRYLRGDRSALATLIRYNRADIAAMGAIFDRALSRLDVQPDLFAPPVDFLRWSAPRGWRSSRRGLPSPNASMAKAPHFSNVFAGTDAHQWKIVGIDLTGSEKRGSGWCLLHGSQAETAMLFTDAELIERTLASSPDLVSIDSPLCLPAGRMIVDDSDPGREQYGIMRQCERELKRRGVNVYPCLLPSMQRLTERGIRLANVLREKGIPVIESYPGAAQDIMRIPRKRAGIEWLKLGLSEFGVSGDYQREKVTHDELDAITSALVGTFHLAGLSEALGADQEPPLIIPDTSAKPGPFVVGLSGPIAAGKTTFARALERKGFAYTRFSLVIDELLREKGLPLDRTNRQSLGFQINSSGRQRWLAEKTVNRVPGVARIVVDGLRFPEDHAFLAERFGARFRHIHIDADTVLRRGRYTQDNGQPSFEEAIGSGAESRVASLLALADEVFENNGPKSEIERRVEELVLRVTRGSPCLSQSS